MKAESKITCAVRKRPLTRRELNKNETDIINVTSRSSLTICEPRQKVDLTKYIEEHEFNFDACYDETTTNQVLYSSLIRPLIASLYSRAKVTVFAYGQTGSGKTYTMLGDMANNIPGLYLLAAYDIFSVLKSDDYSDLQVGISFFEIYCDKTYDLLNHRNQCNVMTDGKDNVNIVGLTERVVGRYEDLMTCVVTGLGQRVTGSTGMNDDSSRSHAVLQICLRKKENAKLYGKLSFIDLAGNERGADVKDTNKQTLIDGTEINKSLLALKECIRAMDLNSKHLPFRNSKLTLVLKDSFIGNCKTVMIGNISPCASSTDHTLNTLRYTDRVKELGRSDKNKDKNDLSRQMLLPRDNKSSRIIPMPKKSTMDFITHDRPDARKLTNNHNQRLSMAQGMNRSKSQWEKGNSKMVIEPKPMFIPQDKLFAERGNVQAPVFFQNKTSLRTPDSSNLLSEDSKDMLLRDLINAQESMLVTHAQYIEDNVKYIKKDMQVIQSAADSPNDIVTYVMETRRIISEKRECLDRLDRELSLIEATICKLDDSTLNTDNLFSGNFVNKSVL